MQAIPHQNPVKAAFRKLEDALQKVLDFSWVGLIFEEASIPVGCKAMVQLEHKIVRVNAVAIVGHKTDGVLVGARKIQNRKTGTFF